MSRHMMLAAALVALPAAAQAQMAQMAGQDGFSGPYVGVHVGLGKRSLDQSIAGLGFDDSRESFDYGIFGGFDAPVGDRLIAGGEAEIGGGGNELRDRFDGVTTEVDPRWNYSLSGRLGYLPNPDVLLYGRLGYAAERVRTTVTDPAVTLSSRDNEWLDGLMLGGGVEFLVNPMVRVRGEFRYKDLDGDYNPRQLLIGASLLF